MPKRLFIAIDPAPAAMEKINNIISNIKRDYPIQGIRYTHPKNIHLTLRFLGDTEDQIIPKISLALDRICKQTDEFNITLSGLGAFPSARSPRILWLAVADPTKPRMLADLIRTDPDIPKETESKPYLPHLTLGRLSYSLSAEASKTFSALVSNGGKFSAGSSFINEVILYQSVLRPDGPTYSVLSRHPLKKLC